MISIKEKRFQIGIPEDAVLMISVGELSNRKNHKVVIQALSGMNMSNVYYVIVGEGLLRRELSNLIQLLGLEEKVFLLGYRTDIKELLNCADLFVFPSIQEGLPVSLMEAMASGLPCVVSRIRGNVDLIDEGRGGLFFSPKSPESIADLIGEMIGEGQGKMKRFGQYNINKVKEFDIREVSMKMSNLYLGGSVNRISKKVRK